MPGKTDPGFGDGAIVEGSGALWLTDSIIAGNGRYGAVAKQIGTVYDLNNVWANDQGDLTPHQSRVCSDPDDTTNCAEPGMLTGEKDADTLEDNDVNMDSNSGGFGAIFEPQEPVGPPGPDSMN